MNNITQKTLTSAWYARTNAKPYSIFDHLHLDEFSSSPKYLQIANFFLREITNGNIQVGNCIPSINELSIELDIARDTVERAYKHLKRIGVFDSVARRGFYVRNVETIRPYKIFLLFNKLSAHKKTLYDSFVAAMGENAVIDLYIYNNNVHLFRRLLLSKQEDYTHYVIIPHFQEGAEMALELVNSLPKDKLILLDKLMENVKGEYGAAFENFQSDIYNALVAAKKRLLNYSAIKLLFPLNSYYPPEIIYGLKKFCIDHQFRCSVVDDIETDVVREGDVFINVMEDNLVPLIEKIADSGFEIGRQVGIISYNETPVKKYILNGITTISTDFRYMGATAAQLILGNSHSHVQVPFRLTLRSTL